MARNPSPSNVKQLLARAGLVAGIPQPEQNAERLDADWVDSALDRGLLQSPGEAEPESTQSRSLVETPLSLSTLSVDGQPVRALKPPVDLRSAGPVLLVRLSYGGTFADRSRPKYGPGHDSDAVIFENTMRWWAIRKLRDQWHADPENAPKAVIGLVGPVEDRVIISSVAINKAWSTGAIEWSWDGDFVEIVPAEETSTELLNYGKLRFRQTSTVRFGQSSAEQFVWVDRNGQVRAGGSHRWPVFDEL